MRRRPVPRPFFLTAGVVSAALLALGACSSSAENPATTTTVPVTATTAAPASTTTTAATIPPAPPSGPTTPTDPTAQQAGQRLIDAWTAGDIDAAVAAVGSDVANALFSHPSPDAVETLPCRGSEGVPDAIECDYSSADGVVTLVITGNAGNGYRVVNVGFIAA